MNTNFFIPPHSCLAPFIDNYILASNDATIAFNNDHHANTEASPKNYMFIANQQHNYNNGHADAILTNKYNCLVGILTGYNGYLYFNGKHNTFIIQIKANGFNKIFRMLIPEISNKIFSAGDVFGNMADSLDEQMVNPNNIQQMAHFADAFLLSFLNQQKETVTIYDGITIFCRELYNSPQLSRIVEYASKANMSIRNFERKFAEQVGMSPKSFARLVRINKIVKNKLMHPAKSWTTIAYESGYYDQMHMIKDFKKFTNLNPTNVFQSNLYKCLVIV